MKDYYTLDEVERLTGKCANTLRTQLNRNELTGIKVPKSPGGKRLVWALTWPVIESLKADAPKENSYNRAVERWKEEQRTGFKREAPLKETTIERNEYGLKAFWVQLGGEKTIERVTVQNVSLAIANVPRNKPATRENIYQSMMSFYRSLIHQGLKSELDLLRFKDFKPSRNKRPRRTFVKDGSTFEKLLLANEAWYDGRSKYDRVLTDILLRFAAMTGLRNTEMCNLMLRDVDFKDQVIYVEQGKGDKDREVGIDPDLIGPLKKYLEKRPCTQQKNFFVQENGSPLNRWVVRDRIKNVAARIGLDLTPHGLRRTFITNLLMQGAPTVLVQRIVGHNQLTTTEKYNMSTSKDALDLLRKRGEVAPAAGAGIEF